MPTKLTNTAGTWLTSMTLSLIARVHLLRQPIRTTETVATCRAGS